MSRRPLVGAVVAAAAAGAAMLARHQVPAHLREPWDRTNHAGRTVSLLEGPVYAVAAAVGTLAAGSPSAPGLVASLGAGAFGALDDLAGDSSSKGLKGHLGALARGEVTTGAIKIAGLAATGLAAAAVTDRRVGRGLLTTLVGGAAIAGSANLANLFDLRPGRTLKVTTLAALPLLMPPHANGAATAAAALGAAAGTLPSDLRGESMLGDTGANAAGALVGLALIERSGLRGRIVLLAVTAGLTVLSEKVSFSRVIEGNPVLRAMDSWGRP
ncbi:MULTISPECIES: hypothetical protein [unclassified Knoellia]|uniref:hypothetical protein n=1 Tax=Knoellia altitudinis TaxID=3404795 RepID=UPI0036233D09